MLRLSTFLLLLAFAAAAFQGYRQFDGRVGAWRIDDPQSEPAIAVLLRADDCGAYDSAIALLNEAARAGARVWGVVVDNQGRPIEPRLAGMPTRIDFEIRPEAAPWLIDLVRQLGYRGTPFVVSVDSEGRVRRVLPPMESALAHREALKRMLELLSQERNVSEG